MHFKALAVAALALVGAATAQRPTDTSICDYYTTALFINNTADFQHQLIMRIVNIALVGNHAPSPGVNVTGILYTGTYNGIKVNLLPYFDGGFFSTNGGGKPISVDFLDSGGLATLSSNKAADSMSSNQYFLMTHLYQYFGVLLGCSKQGGTEFPAYSGSDSQYKVHKFMDLSDAEVNYFIEQVALSASSFGVSASDLMIIGYALRQSFGYRCLPPATIIPSQGAQLQSICTDSTCPLAPNNTCASYDQTITKPKLDPCYVAKAACYKAPGTSSNLCNNNYLICKASGGIKTNGTTSPSNTCSCSGSGPCLCSASGSASCPCSDSGSCPCSDSGSCPCSNSGSCPCSAPKTESGTGFGTSSNKTSGTGSSKTNSTGTGTGSGSDSKTNGTTTATKPTQLTAGAATVGVGFAAIAGGLLAFFL
ncbi:9c788a51-f507-4f6e-8599-559a463500c0 [Sclerotinia trifoliorum]|uniref:9c788a51-f507-4f6e-8599-559a463500c0 n=1 Tax=Sclerotinia trifoliorum TaxID=28548 RepID=A0A8H2VN35_9HELO|nr:9c788a51-f507-4f6e-8599-559a463500c0 [Sclerotinia trifoliorum]